MKLKEKFNALVPIKFGGMQEPLLSDCEKIADEFAIEFLEWLASNEATILVNDLIIVGEINCNPTPKELLEIFKKEKGYE
jgi:hypothetical protein